jgi:exonuclease VII small subunit
MAANLEKIDEIVAGDLEFIRAAINSKAFKNMQPLDKEVKLKELLNKVRTCKNVLSNYDLSLTAVGTKDAEIYQPKYEEKMRMLKDLEFELKSIKDKLNKEAFEVDTNDAQRVFATAAPSKPINQMNKEEAFKEGDRLLRKMDEDLDSAFKILVDGKQLQDEINVELQRIEEQLIKAEEAAKDTQSLLKRSAQLINYFKRQLQTDKIIWCCLIIVVLLVLAVIIMSFAGVKSSYFNSKILPNQN